MYTNSVLEIRPKVHHMANKNDSALYAVYPDTDTTVSCIWLRTTATCYMEHDYTEYSRLCRVKSLSHSPLSIYGVSACTLYHYSNRKVSYPDLTTLRVPLANRSWYKRKVTPAVKVLRLFIQSSKITILIKS